jgi:hypothetical protein
MRTFNYGNVDDFQWLFKDYINNGNLEELYDKLDIIVNKTIKA